MRMVPDTSIQECTVTIYDVTDHRGNTVTVSRSLSDGEDAVIKYQFQVSGDMMKATVLETTYIEEREGVELNLNAVDTIPVDLNTCDTLKSQSRVVPVPSAGRPASNVSPAVTSMTRVRKLGWTFASADEARRIPARSDEGQETLHEHRGTL